MSAANHHHHHHQDPESESAASETTTLLPTTGSPEQPENTPKMSTSTLFWRVGAMYGAAAVGLGAFGAHGLKKRISDPNKIASWSTAAHYQLVHSAVVLVASHHPVASALFTAGMTMFSGSIYALTLDTERFRFLGPVTPVGGLFLIAGWLALAFASKGTAVARFPRF
ncbi:hypothetical protein QBC32DRAFT_327352 [Pseudoneurospora amorphoporcata]|uniref:DUF423-domain-containing protein n=1 Tax=Pseudoneurospora amorphoporcata TaxID=241081 RepID=A0AAN6NN78_9PEZI|nr:hypothetical protein QBC32DRAFT_327352 [Pseudoneurospora amorphoporcata]